MTDTKDDVELPERSAQNVMMSAHALCPTDMSHPERMAWMADYFMREYARQAVRMERERCARLCEQEGDIVRKGISVMGMHLGMRDPTVYDELVAAIRKGESRG